MVVVGSFGWGWVVGEDVCDRDGFRGMKIADVAAIPFRLPSASQLSLGEPQDRSRLVCAGRDPNGPAAGNPEAWSSLPARHIAVLRSVASLGSGRYDQVQSLLRRSPTPSKPEGGEDVHRRAVENVLFYGVVINPRR